nr:hypothetical protein [Tanacetum cinerariifolium]
MGLDAGSHLSTPAAQDPSTATKSVSDPEPLPYANPQSHPEQDIAQSSEGTTNEIPTEDAATTGLTSSSPWGGVTNDCRLDAPNAYQDLVDHIAPPGYFPELRHLPNADFLSEYNTTLARQVAMGSRLRLRFEQEVRLLNKARSKIARQDLRIQVRDEEIKKLDQEMNKQLSEQVLNLQAQVMGEEKIKAAFEEFKKYEDDKVEQWCAEMDARLDKLSVDFDEELYPHMLTAIAGRRWVIGHGLRLAVMKCAESSEIRSDGIPVSVPTVPQGLAILLADAATQAEAADQEEPYPRL